MGKAGRIYRNLDVDETGVAAVAKPCKLTGYFLYNAATSARFLKLYDMVAAPTVGTHTPVLTIALPASSGANMYDADGICDFTHGLGVGATTAVADNSTASPGTNDVTINLFWKSIGG